MARVDAWAQDKFVRPATRSSERLSSTRRCVYQRAVGTGQWALGSGHSRQWYTIRTSSRVQCSATRKVDGRSCRRSGFRCEVRLPDDEKRSAPSLNRPSKHGSKRAARTGQTVAVRTKRAPLPVFHTRQAGGLCGPRFDLFVGLSVRVCVCAAGRLKSLPHTRSYIQASRGGKSRSSGPTHALPSTVQCSTERLTFLVRAAADSASAGGSEALPFRNRTLSAYTTHVQPRPLAGAARQRAQLT